MSLQWPPKVCSMHARWSLNLTQSPQKMINIFRVYYGTILSYPDQCQGYAGTLQVWCPVSVFCGNWHTESLTQRFPGCTARVRSACTRVPHREGLQYPRQARMLWKTKFSPNWELNQGVGSKGRYRLGHRFRPPPAVFCGSVCHVRHLTANLVLCIIVPIEPALLRWEPTRTTTGF